MIILLSFVISYLNSFACEFSKDVTSVYSLSGPITLALRDLKLIQSPKLRAISAFHPSQKSFKGEIFPGGLYLSMDRLQKMKGAIVFYDESRELTNSFKRVREIKGIEIKTRQLMPLAVSHYIEKVLRPYVIGCNFSQMHRELEIKLEKLSKNVVSSKSYLFFLGEIRGKRFPEMLMVQDGVIQWLVDKAELKTYPSKLSYVVWSTKVLQSMPQNTIKVGLIDSGNKMVYQKIQKGDIINLTFPGCLIPGTGQVECLLYFFKP